MPTSLPTKSTPRSTTLSAQRTRTDERETQPDLTGQKIWLNCLRRRYHRRSFVHTDPLVVLYRYDELRDREVVGLIASSLAYGRVASILDGVDRVLSRMGQSPWRYLTETPTRRLRSHFRGFRYRVTSDAAFTALLLGMRHAIRQHGGLNECFVSGMAPEDKTVVAAMGAFVDAMRRGGNHGLDHLLPHPDRGSACKRLNLFLRWMVRRDAVDPGGWHGLRPDQLIVPLDVHMHRMAQLLGWTQRRLANLRTALEVTEVSRRFCPADPLKYDFALTRPGILRSNHSLGLPPPLPSRERGRGEGGTVASSV